MQVMWMLPFIIVMQINYKHLELVIMVIKLNIQERFILTGILPEKGNFETMSLLEGLSKKLYPTEKELDKYEIKYESDKITWNSKAKEEKDIDFTDKEIELLNKRFSVLSEKEEVTLNQYLVYKKLQTK